MDEDETDKSERDESESIEPFLFNWSGRPCPFIFCDARGEVCRRVFEGDLYGLSHPQSPSARSMRGVRGPSSSSSISAAIPDPIPVIIGPIGPGGFRRVFDGGGGGMYGTGCASLIPGGGLRAGDGVEVVDVLPGEYFGGFVSGGGEGFAFAWPLG